ncbi:hypothetical protein EEB18_019655 [Sphingopyxis sp. OPL5]|jgi:hypothetical protein|uniref:hypothetical protein n=1 Tax=Sphingopyxis sp. OPL5 TaxID=2486273 RepID=UPI00164D5DEB|nr:hypothetical protein [Sphingopyxis sp. OPL5]QNO26904.1 hypothetical protein EEB18_019655 [Sphingopyxis sp. OPL5]
MRGVVLSLGLALFAVSFHAKAAAEEAERSTLLVQIVTPAEYVGVSQWCVDAIDDGDLCVGELYEADVKVLRHLGGPPTAARLKMRFTAHSFSSKWQRDVRFLLVASPFEDKGSSGYFTNNWDWENRDGLFCREAEDAADEDDGPLKRLYATRQPEVVPIDTRDWSKGTQVICVTGNEVLRD